MLGKDFFSFCDVSILDDSCSCGARKSGPLLYRPAGPSAICLDGPLLSLSKCAVPDELGMSSYDQVWTVGASSLSRSRL